MYFFSFTCSSRLHNFTSFYPNYMFAESCTDGTYYAGYHTDSADDSNVVVPICLDIVQSPSNEHCPMFAPNPPPEKEPTCQQMSPTLWYIHVGKTVSTVLLYIHSGKKASPCGAYVPIRQLHYVPFISDCIYLFRYP